MDPPPVDATGDESLQLGSVQRMLLTERGDPSVACPSWEPLPSHLLFGADGLPHPDVVKEHFLKEGLLSEVDALRLITRCALIWKEEPNVVQLEDPVVIAGDIHGQFFDLVSLLGMGGDPATQKYIFLGDYVDRGCFGMEVILLLMCYKIRFSKTFVMLRGNHESRHLTAYFNFKREVLYKYSLPVYNAMMSAFDCLPLACIINSKFLCIHGGLSPELKHIADFNAIHRFREPPSFGAMCDLLWADPMDEKEDDPNCPQFFIPNTTRGCSYVHSHKAVSAFLKENNLTTVIRGHEAQDEGYHLYKKTASGFPSVICVFSAPNYCDTYDNRATVIDLNKSVMNIRQFNSCPHPYYLPNFMNAFTWSLPFVGEKLLDIWSNMLQVVGAEDDRVAIGVDLPGCPSELPEDRAQRIREKVAAMGELSHMFHALRDASESSTALKHPSSPSLLQVRDHPSLPAVGGFAQSRKIDGVNERWPDSPLESEEDTVPNAVSEAQSDAWEG